MCEMISCSLEDGKRNVVGPAFVVAMNDCLDRADADKAKAIVLEGRAGTFSAGFDLKEFQKGPRGNTFACAQRVRDASAAV